MARPREGLALKQQQRLTLTPDMRTSLEILRLPSGLLRDMLEEIAEENPVLSLSFPHGRDAGQPNAMDVALETTGAPLTLGDLVRQQIGLMTLPEDVARGALALSWSLTDEGYLDGTLSELAKELNTSLDVMEAALRAVQACEPAGVGARSLAECLALQLVEHGIDRALADRTMRSLDLIAAGALDRAARQTGVPLAEISRIKALLPALTPFPGQSVQPAPRIQSPDVELRFDGGGRPELILFGAGPDVLRVDADLLSAARRDQHETLREYGAQAEALRRALAFRSKTLLRIVNALVAHQAAFFRNGGESMQPLTRDALAQTVGLHPTTVGRAVADKTLLYPGGMLPLSTFFSARLGSETQDTASAYGVQTKIAALVASERPQAILTDDEIAHKLKHEGVDIARRTVAKYRRCLNIPSSYERKRLRAESKMHGRTTTSG